MSNPNKKTITVKEAQSVYWPTILRPIVDQISAINEAPYPEQVFYVINKGQSGVNKIPFERFFCSYDEAEKFRKDQDEFIRIHSEVRCALFVDGATVKP